MSQDELFYHLQTWWLYEYTNPAILQAVRIYVLSIGAVGLLICLWQTLKPYEYEATWDPRDYRKANVINAWKMLGYLGLVIFQVFALLFETERMSSPNRVLVFQTVLAILVMGDTMQLLFWRVHYLKKRSFLKNVQGKDVHIK